MPCEKSAVPRYNQTLNGAAAGRTIRVLVVEDDGIWQHLVGHALRNTRSAVTFEATFAGTLRQAREHLTMGRFDMVLLDLGLPDSQGLDTYHAIRKTAPDTPVIMLTGTDDEQVGIEAIRCGAGDFLFKGENAFNDVLVRTALHVIERSRQDDVLRQSERNLRGIINAGRDAVIVTDLQSTILFVNPAAERLYGQNAEQLLGARFEHELVAGAAGEISLKAPGGRCAVVEMQVAAIEWQGHPAFLASLHDVTELRTARRKLHKYRENLRVLVAERLHKVDAEKELLSVTFSSMAEGVIVVDPDKRIVLFNRLAETLAGWEFEPVQDRPLGEMFHVVDGRTGQVQDAIVDKVLRIGRTQFGGEHDILVGLDGRDRPVSMVAAPVRQDEDRVIGVVIVFRDISKERRLERLKEDFIASISHELRTPLTCIKAYTETIIDDDRMDSQTRGEFLRIINQESDRLAQLIEGLLEISRLESGRAALAPGRVDLCRLVEKAAVALRPVADRKDVRIETLVDPRLPAIEADASKTESVITNLANNAVKFTEPGGVVRISAEQHGPLAAIRVSDTGMGIPPEDLPHIFERFYRVGATALKVPGTGLGLAIVKKIVDMHGGSIEVHSKLGKGTTFTVLLPITSKSPTSGEITVSPVPAAV